MDCAFVKHPQHDIDGDDGRQNQEGLIGQRCLKGGGGSLKAGLNARRHPQPETRRFHRLDGSPERCPRGQVERHRNHRKLPLVVDGEGGFHFLQSHQASQWNSSCACR